jgi:hypothetical protein
MATYTVQSVVETGLNPTYTAVGATDTFTPASADLDKIHILHVKNGGGTPDTVSVDDPNSTSPAGAAQFNPDLSVSVPATTGDRLIRINPRRHVAAGTGAVTVTHSFTTSVTAAVFVA